MDVRLPDGTIIKNVPEGTTQAQLSARLEGFDGPTIEPELPTVDPVNPFLAHPIAKFAAGTFLGLKQAGTGFEQLTTSAEQLIHGDVEERQQELKREVSERDIQIGEIGGPAVAGGMVGEALPSVALPGGPTGGIVRRVAGGVAADVLASVADPVREEETRLGNLERAATFSAALRVPGASVSSVFRRVSNARAGNIKDADVKNILDAADNEQIRVFFDDVSKGSFARQASAAAEIFGRLGTGAGRIKQNEEALAAATRWLNRASGDTDDFAEIVQTGLKRKLALFKREASRKYDRVAREIGDAGAVSTKTFDSAADAGIASEAAKGTRANAAVVDFLNRFKEAPRGDFDAMIEFRSDFNKELGDFLKGDVSISHSSIEALTKAGEALTDDMSAFAKANGAERSWRAANQFYQNTVLQFKKGKLKGLLNEKSAANFDEQAAWNYLVQNSTNPKRARLMFQSLDSEGREAVRFGLIKEAFEKAAPDGAPFSPAKFAGYLEKRQPVVDQFFKGRSGDEINGLIKVMRQIQQAGSVAISPPTGARAIPVGIAAITAADPSTGAFLLGSAVTLKGLFQTKVGRNLLLAANTATPGSQKADKILEEILKVTSRASN